MKFMLHVIGRQADTFDDDGPTPEAFVAWAEKAAADGVLVDSGFYDPYDQAASVEGPPTGADVTIGPPAGSTEYLGGFAVVDVASRDEAIEWAASNPGARFGRIEVRQLFG